MRKKSKSFNFKYRVKHMLLIFVRLSNTIHLQKKIII